MKTRVRSFKDLLVWQHGMKLVRDIYGITQAFPPEERFELTRQLRRAAISIPCNIAEGNGRSRNGDYVRFLLVARGSCQELETQLLIAEGQHYVPEQEIARLQKSCADIMRMLAGLVRALEARSTAMAKPNGRS